MKPCTGCKYDSKRVMCTHPDFNEPDFFYRGEPIGEDEYPPCYKSEEQEAE